MAVLKYLFIILFFTNIAFATSLDNVKKQILYNISYLLTHKQKVKIYIDNKEFNNLSKFNNKIIRVKNCNDAEIIIIDNISKLPKNCLNKIIISSTFSTFKNNPYVTGAIFWQKGRVNIIFKKNKVLEFTAKLDKDLEKYLDE